MRRLRLARRVFGLGLLILGVGLVTLNCQLWELMRTPPPPVQGPQRGSEVQGPPTVSVAPSATPTPEPTPTPDVLQTLLLAQRALFYGDWDTARSLYKQVYQTAASPEERAWALLGWGRTHYLERDYPSALRRLRQLQEEFPDTIPAQRAHLFLALTYRRLQRFADEAASWQAFLPYAPEPLAPYVYEWMGDALFNAADYGPAAAAYEAALEFQPFPPRVYGLYMGMARAYHILNQMDQALEAYQKALEHAPNDFERAFALYQMGQVYLQQGKIKEGFEIYLQVVIQYPKSPYAYRALVALIDAERAVPDLERGIVDYYAAQYLPGLRALKRYLAANPQPPDATAYYYKGLIHQALGSYTEAIETWQIIVQRYPGDRWWDKAWEAIAETYARHLQDYQTASQTYLEFVNQVPEHPRAGDFLFRAARYQEILFNLQDAASLWHRMAQAYPLHPLAPRAFILAGVTYIRLGDVAKARQVFQQAAEAVQDPYWRAAAYLWLGKLAAQQGDLTTAQQEWTRAAALDPTGYYSERARDLLEGRAPFARPLAYDTGIDWDRERAEAAQWVRQTFGLPPQEDLLSPGPLANDPRYQRGLWLWEFGFYDEARDEWESLRKDVANDPANTFRLIYEAQKLGMYRTAILASRRLLDLAGLDEFTALTAPVYFHHVRFGPYYADLVVPIAQEYDFHPLFLYALIRQESLFEGFIASKAGAQGLMQIIPQTGQYLAQQQGWPPNYTEEDLLRPLVSLRLGVAYLNQQRNTFNENLFAALAAYNAGPGNARIWYELAPQDPDLFLEMVRFGETHLYLRRIYENYRMYYRLYARNP